MKPINIINKLNESDAIAELDSLTDVKTKKFTKEDKKQFADSIDDKPLIDEIESLIGAKNIHISCIVENDDYHDSYKLELGSENIKDYCGVLSKFMKSVHVGTFTSYISENEDHTALRAFIKIGLHCKHLNGKYNDIELFGATYENGKWDFNVMVL